jgi:RNA polymerase sigma-54 factor
MTASLQLRAGQQLTMTPFLQRAIQLLPLSSLEFSQQVQDIMTTNPFLEASATAEDPGAVDRADTAEPDDPTDGAVTGDDPADAPADALDDLWSRGAAAERPSRAGDDDRDPALKVPSAPTLREHLLRQAGCLRLSDRDRMMVHAIIETIDGSGYLTQPLEELCRLCPLDPPADADEMRIALRHVQCLDPTGVGARSVAECLQLQLSALEPDRHPARDLAQRIVGRHLDLLAAHDFQRLQRELGCDAARLQAATVLLRGLTPRPGAAWGTDDPQFVVADVIVQARERRWVVSINPEVIPRIHVSRFHAGLLRGGGSAVSEQLREARWLVRNIEQRFRTIRLVAQAIVDHQSRFFEHGPMAMRPLTLGEIAQKVGLHESTVSRITSRKYMATPRGLLEFRHFFGSHVETAAGTPCSATAVRALITELIAAEDATRPLSDIRLTRLLEQRGIRVARRTVSKYRDALRIPSVEVRRMSHRPQA